MRILLIDDHQLFRSGIKFLLAELDNNVEFYEASSCDAALEINADQGIDLILLDYHLPGMLSGSRGLDAIRKKFDCSLVMLSSEDDPRIARDAIERGASGYIPKSSSPDILVAALKLVLANGVYLPPCLLNTRQLHVKEQQSSSELPAILMDNLSRKQQNVLIKAAQGKPNKLIARELHIAEGTVKAHLSACYKALKVENRTEAVYAVASLGLVDVPQMQG